jgi:hypothetical protein
VDDRAVSLPHLELWLSLRAMSFLAFTHTNSAGVLRLRPSAIRKWTDFGALVERDGAHWLADEVPEPAAVEAVSNCS